MARGEEAKVRLFGCGVKKMSKKILAYIFVLLVLFSGALAVGIGAKNIQILPEGNKTIELFVINDVEKEMVVGISVLGGKKEGIEIVPEEIHFMPEEHIKKFYVNLDFSKISNNDIRIYASEIYENEGQISTSTNVVYKLPIVDKIYENKTTERKNIQKYNKTLNQTATIKIFENKKEIVKEKSSLTEKISGASTQEKSPPVIDFSFEETDSKKFAFAAISIIAFIFLIDLFFMERKTPIERYIEKTRKMGKTDEEIRNKLREAGWDDSVVEQFLRK